MNIRFLGNLSIGGKLTLAVLPPVIGLLVYSGLAVFDRYQQASELSRVSALAAFAPTISALVHELQKERGQSAGFIGGKGQKFAQTLPGRRRDSDGQRTAFEEAYAAFDFSAFDAKLVDQARSALGQLGQLRQMRDQVDGLTVTVPQMAKYYTDTIGGLLKIVEQMLRNSSDDNVSKAIGGYIAYLQGKERAGLERAMGAVGFGAAGFEPVIYRRFLRLIALQEIFLDNFRLFAGPEQWTYHATTVTGPIVAEVDRMREIAIASPRTGDTGGVEATQWWGAITAKIDLMKQVEDRLATDLQALASGLISTAHMAVIVFAAVSLLLIIVGCGLLFVVTRDILRAVGGLTAVMRTLADGDKTVEIVGAGRGDEVGRMAEAVQVFKDNMIRNDELVAEQEQLTRAKEALAIQAARDSLTGLLNHGAIVDALVQEMARAQREKLTLCIGFCDIDHFKWVNDIHGHLVGDAVLRETARRFTATLRPYDQVGRYGGEEFLILVEATREQAPAVFERIRRVFNDAPITLDQATLEVTVSCGVTFFTPPEDERNATELLAAADAALYRAKDAGRNRTVFS